MTMNLLQALVSELRKRLLGISPDEIRYTFDDVRAELRSTRAELKEEIDKLHRELDSLPSRQDRPKGPEIPVAEA
jgi:polyhydroxyalkanoate synthesis regulator phasin